MLSIYSYTALNTYRTCPQKFKFHYVDKADVPKRIAADTYLGSAVHRVLVKLYKYGADGIVYPMEDMIAFYRKQWESIEREYITLMDEYHTVDDYIRLGEKMLVKHYERYRPFDQGTLLGTEIPLYFSLQGTNFKFNVKIDRLWKNSRGVVEICDYKTGRHLAKPQDESFFYQMGLYQLAVQENYPQFEKIELTQHFLRMDEMVSYRMRPDEMDRLVEDIRVAVIESIQAERLDDFPPKEGPLCTYCDYSILCPAKRHQAMLKRVEDEGEDDDRILGQKAYEIATRYLEIYQRSREAKAELEALRAEIVQFAKDQKLTTFEGESGRVTVKVGRQEKFVTKSVDDSAFAELSHLAREWKLDEYFDLNPRALMKEVYKKERLSPTQLEKLKPYVLEKEESRVTVKLNRERDLDEG